MMLTMLIYTLISDGLALLIYFFKEEMSIFKERSVLLFEVFSRGEFGRTFSLFSIVALLSFHLRIELLLF